MAQTTDTWNATAAKVADGKSAQMEWWRRNFPNYPPFRYLFGPLYSHQDSPEGTAPAVPTATPTLRGSGSNRESFYPTKIARTSETSLRVGSTCAMGSS